MARTAESPRPQQKKRAIIGQSTERAVSAAATVAPTEVLVHEDARDLAAQAVSTVQTGAFVTAYAAQKAAQRSLEARRQFGEHGAAAQQAKLTAQGLSEAQVDDRTAAQLRVELGRLREEKQAVGQRPEKKPEDRNPDTVDLLNYGNTGRELREAIAEFAPRFQDRLQPPPDDAPDPLIVVFMDRMDEILSADGELAKVIKRMDISRDQVAIELLGVTKEIADENRALAAQQRLRHDQNTGALEVKVDEYQVLLARPTPDAGFGEVINQNLVRRSAQALEGQAARLSGEALKQMKEAERAGEYILPGSARARKLNKSEQAQIIEEYGRKAQRKENYAPEGKAETQEGRISPIVERYRTQAQAIRDRVGVSHPSTNHPTTHHSDPEQEKQYEDRVKEGLQSRPEGASPDEITLYDIGNEIVEELFHDPRNRDLLAHLMWIEPRVFNDPPTHDIQEAFNKTRGGQGVVTPSEKFTVLERLMKLKPEDLFIPSVERKVDWREKLRFKISPPLLEELRRNARIADEIVGDIHDPQAPLRLAALPQHLRRPFLVRLPKRDREALLKAEADFKRQAFNDAKADSTDAPTLKHRARIRFEQMQADEMRQVLDRDKIRNPRGRGKTRQSERARILNTIKPGIAELVLSRIGETWADPERQLVDAHLQELRIKRPKYRLPAIRDNQIAERAERAWRQSQAAYARRAEDIDGYDNPRWRNMMYDRLFMDARAHLSEDVIQAAAREWQRYRDLRNNYIVDNNPDAGAARVAYDGARLAVSAAEQARNTAEGKAKKQANKALREARRQARRAEIAYTQAIETALGEMKNQPNDPNLQPNIQQALDDYFTKQLRLGKMSHAQRRAEEVRRRPEKAPQTFLEHTLRPVHEPIAVPLRSGELLADVRVQREDARIASYFVGPIAQHLSEGGDAYAALLYDGLTERAQRGVWEYLTTKQRELLRNVTRDHDVEHIANVHIKALTSMPQVPEGATQSDQNALLVAQADYLRYIGDPEVRQRIIQALEGRTKVEEQVSAALLGIMVRFERGSRQERELLSVAGNLADIMLLARNGELDLAGDLYKGLSQQARRIVNQYVNVVALLAEGLPQATLAQSPEELLKQSEERRKQARVNLDEARKRLREVPKGTVIAENLAILLRVNQSGRVARLENIDSKYRQVIVDRLIANLSQQIQRIEQQHQSDDDIFKHALSTYRQLGTDQQRAAFVQRNPEEYALVAELIQLERERTELQQRFHIDVRRQDNRQGQNKRWEAGKDAVAYGEYRQIQNLLESADSTDAAAVYYGLNKQAQGQIKRHRRQEIGEIEQLMNRIPVDDLRQRAVDLAETRIRGKDLSEAIEILARVRSRVRAEALDQLADNERAIGEDFNVITRIHIEEKVAVQAQLAKNVLQRRDSYILVGILIDYLHAGLYSETGSPMANIRRAQIASGLTESARKVLRQADPQLWEEVETIMHANPPKREEIAEELARTIKIVHEATIGSDLYEQRMEDRLRAIDPDYRQEVYQRMGLQESQMEAFENRILSQPGQTKPRRKRGK